MWYVVLAVVIAATATHAATITGIEPSSGSLAGGTRIRIYGTDFSNDRFTGGNVVYVGPYPCTVINHRTSTTVITCVTAPADTSGSYSLAVIVDGNDVNTFCCFSYSRSVTTTLSAVWPPAVPAGGQVTFYGYPSWVTNQDCRPDASLDGEISCIGVVTVGDYVCTTNAGSFTPATGWPRFNWDWRYRLTCDLPAPSQAVLGTGVQDVQPGLGVAGRYNTSISWEGWAQGGRALATPSSYTPWLSGAPSQLTVVPVVTGVTPATGSLAGGTTVTITGAGFPSSAAADGITQLLLGGVPCQVQSSNYSAIVCTTGAASGSAAAGPALKGWWPGLSGINYDVWYNMSVDYSGLPPVLNNWTTSGPGVNASSSTLMDVWEVPLYTEQWFTTRTRAFFRAPVTGPHTFSIVADDYAQLTASWLQGGVLVSRQLVNATTWTGGGYDSWAGGRINQTSAPLNLAAGDLLLLETVHSQGPGGTQLQVGVTIPSPTATLNSQPDVQRVTLAASQWSAQQTITLAWPAVNSSALQLDVRVLPPTANGSDGTCAWDGSSSSSSCPIDDASRSSSASRNGSLGLRHPQLGLMLVVNGQLADAPLPVTSLLVDNRTAAEVALTATLQQLPPFNISGSGVRVLRAYQDQRQLVFVVTYNQTRVNTSVTVTANLVQLAAAPAVTSSATCYFADPVWVLSGSTGNQTVYAPSFPRLPIGPTLVAPVPGLDLQQLQARVSPLQLASQVPANTSGWMVWANNITATELLPWNANASQVQAALRAVTNISLTVSASSVRTGPVWLNRWRVTVPDSVRDNLALLNASLVPDITAAADNPDPTTWGSASSADVSGQQLVVGLANSSSVPLRGVYRLALGEVCDSVELNTTDDEDTIRVKLNTLPNVTVVRVSTVYTKSDGFAYDVQFGRLMGDVPLLRVTNTSGLMGSGANVSVTLVQQGSPNIFLGPIPAQLLSQPVTHPDAISLAVNNVVATCRASAGCRFSHSAAATPTITAVTPSSVSTSSGPAQITITGTGFSTTAAGNSISLGDAACSSVVVVATSSDGASATQLRCTVPSGVAAGRRQVTVFVAGKGDATGAASVDVLSLSVTGFATTPAALAPAGSYTLLTVNGVGFDPVDCTRNRVRLGSSVLLVIGCTATNLTVLLPGTLTAGSQQLTVDVGGDEPGSSPVSATAAAAVTLDSSAGWRVAALTSPRTLPAPGGTVEFSIAGAGFSTSTLGSWSAVLVPYFDVSTLAGCTLGSSCPLADQVNDALAATQPCRQLTAVDAQTARCTLRALPAGRYLLALQGPGYSLVLAPGGSSTRRLQQAAPSGGPYVLEVALGVSAVWPAVGSIGGGALLTVQGAGFNVEEPSANVVLVRVPVSTTNLNGQVLCDVVNVTAGVPPATTLTCITRAHRVADASSDDPFALDIEPRPTDPGLVQVVLCDAGLSDISKFYCWSDPTPRTTCTASDPAACSFSYSWAVTPALLMAAPPLAQAGAVLTINGTNLEDVTRVVLSAAWGSTECPLVYENATHLMCSVPSLPAGSYEVRAQTQLGQWSVPVDAPVRFVYAPILESVEGTPGSVMGGGWINISATSDVFNNTHPNQNRVLVAGQRCELVPGTLTSTSLSCTAPPLWGRVLGEYWPINGYVPDLPADLDEWTNPVGTSTNETVSFTWGVGAPPSLGSTTDLWVGRYTFYLRAPASANYTLRADVDDLVQLWLDDVPVFSGNRGGTVTIYLSAGYHPARMHYLEWWGWSSLTLSWDGGVPGAGLVPIPSNAVSVAPPQVLLPVTATVNGVRALQGCGVITPGASISFGSFSTPGAYGGFTSASAAPFREGRCTYQYSASATPVVDSITPLTADNPGVDGTTLTLVGSDLGAADLRVAVGPSQCTSVTMVNSSAVNCTLPVLPAGQYDVRVTVAGKGTAQFMPGQVSSVQLRYTTGITSLSPSTGSLGGGAPVRVRGWGFLPGGTSSSSLALTTWLSGAAAGCAATLINATSSEVWVQLGRCSPAASTAYWQVGVTVTNTTSATSMGGPSITFVAAPARTPSVSNVAPAQLAPHTAAILNVSWSLGLGSGEVSVGQPGGASAATVLLLPASNASAAPVPCGSPTVTTSTSNSTTSQEQLRCSVPATLPAGRYSVWVCVAPWGCGVRATSVTIPMSVTGVTPTSGSLAGGSTLTITGTGFSTVAAEVVVLVGTAPCRVTASTPTIVTCVTGPMAVNMTADVAADLSVDASLAAPLQAVPGVTFTYSTALTPQLTSLTPARGSTEGGTRLTLTGTFPAAAAGATITIAGLPCGSITQTGTTTLSCTTASSTGGNPSAAKPLGPQQVAVLFPDRGLAASARPGGAAVTYEYVDLWSRSTTWGGGPPPEEGDSVLVPANTTVLLDVSPPRLYALVLEGNLVFDDTATEQLHLQTHYILVKGGNLSIGTRDTPFAGTAAITLHGPADARELPLYGAKVLGVRDGHVVMHGKPKTPTWTRLAATADIGDTQVVVTGTVNWVPGDVIAIASSSFFGEEVDEVAITGVTPGADGNTTLALARPLVYTHLGEVVTVPGDTRGHRLDMRAEVAVLNRSVIFRGDDTSRDTLFGATIMVSTPMNRGAARRATLAMFNVEVTAAGQAFRLGRYPIHWHMHGDAGLRSIVSGCAIHHTFQRAVTVHGTHRVILRNNVAYDNMGHAYFFEDGIETGGIWEGNLGMLTRVSNALLNTDTSPATFWITNPNNTIIGNVAAGSAAYGFWYRMLTNPEGPSTTTTSCPKFTPLAAFKDNVAHSNMFYGLRIFPEYYPKVNPCDSSYNQLPAVFDGLVSYKNGMKCAIATQVGLVQFRNFTVADCGAGPKAHVVNGKDHGGALEITWVSDDRNRLTTPLNNMAGIQNALVISRTEVGQRGSAGRWPSGRGIRGVITHSPPLGDPRHTALLSLLNITMVDWAGEQFRALEACAKCKTFQGGATASTAGFRYLSLSSSPAPVSLASWTWGHQGVFLDTDGTLLPASVLPPGTSPAPGAGWAVGTPGVTLHSPVNNNMFDPVDCVYMASGVGVLCRPSLVFRRVMVNGHAPPALTFRDLLVTSVPANRTSRVFFTNYNEMGYQFTAPTRQEVWLHWDTPVDIPIERLTMHKIDPLNATIGWLPVSMRFVQKYDRVLVNGRVTPTPALTARPTNDSGLAHGTIFYNKNFTALGWWYGNVTYNITTAAVWLAGNTNGALTVTPRLCPEEGCSTLGTGPADFRNGTLYWSDNATWVDRPGGKPAAGQNVTIPEGWDLVLDESPPPLSLLLISGNLTVVNTTDITLTATYVIVQGTGRLVAGTRTAPHPRRFQLLLSGGRKTPELAIRNDLIMGAKTLAAIQGGFISLHGQPLTQRWTRLAATAAAGTRTLTLADTSLPGWTPGRRVLVTSSSYNPWQYEIANISSVATNAGGQVVLTLASSLSWRHAGEVLSYAGSTYTLDSRAEVALLDSTINIAPDNNTAADDEKFGPRVLAAGTAVLHLADVTLTRCGQTGLQRGCVQFQGLSAQNHTSYVRRSVTLDGYDAGLRTTLASSRGAVAVGNVFVGSYDVSTVVLGGSHHVVTGNLALGTFKETSGKASMDTQLPATFEVDAAASNITLTGNAAAGSDRLGYLIPGDLCNSSSGWRYSNNSAHSSLAGMVLLEGGSGGPCTAVVNYTAALTWDFGLISMKGITTDVLLQDVVVADPKHVGVLILKQGAMTQPATVNWTGGLLVGRSSPAVCGLCTKREGITGTGADPGCHPKLSPKSYKQSSPFGPALGMQSSVFAIAFTVGPDKKPWDHVHGYQTVLGNMRVSGLTLADFGGATACPAAADGGTFAIGNHPVAPDAFHPHFFKQVTKVRVAEEGLFKLSEPDPDWRNEADCGEATFKRPDGSLVPLNCAGPRHTYFRDEDGTLLGSAPGSTLLGTYLTQRHASGIDQGTGVLQGPCVWLASPGAYLCRRGVMTTASGWVPSPLPPAGIWGDPQLLVLESRDGDSEDRNFSPVLLSTGGGAQDLVITAMDQGWCFGYTCQKRLSTFWTYAPTGQVATFNFTGTPAKVLRMWLPYASPDTEMVVVLNLLGVNSRRFTWTEVQRRIEPVLAPPTLGNASLGHGAYYWDQDTTTLTLKLRGGAEAVEIRTEAAIQVSQRLAVSLNDFYDMQDRFLANLAFVLGIPPARIKVVRITAGSTVVDYVVTADPALSAAPIPEPSYDTSNNVDPTTAAQLASMTPEQQAAFLGVNTTNTTAGSNSSSSGGGSSGGGSSTPAEASPAALASAELLSVLTTMQTALASGSFAAQTGVQTLGMDVRVVLAAPPAATSSGSSSGGGSSSAPLVQSFNLDQMISAGQAATAPPPPNPLLGAPAAPGPSGSNIVGGGPAPAGDAKGGSKASSLGLAVGLPVALAGVLLVLAGLAAAQLTAKKRRQVGHHSSAGATLTHFDDLGDITATQRGAVFDGASGAAPSPAPRAPSVTQFVPVGPIGSATSAALARHVSFSAASEAALAQAGVLLRPGSPAVLQMAAEGELPGAAAPASPMGPAAAQPTSRPLTPQLLQPAASPPPAAAAAAAAPPSMLAPVRPPPNVRSPSPAGIAALSAFDAVAAMRATAAARSGSPAPPAGAAPSGSPLQVTPRRLSQGSPDGLKERPRLQDPSQGPGAAGGNTSST